MGDNVSPPKNSKLNSLFVWTKMAGVAFNLLLMIGFAGFLMPIALQARELPSVAQTRVSLRQSGFTSTNRITSTSTFSTATPLDLSTSSIFEITLDELGYSEKNLTSPWDVATYSFYLPEDW